MQSGQVAQNAVENNSTELSPWEFEEIKNDNTGAYAKDTLNAVITNKEMLLIGTSFIPVISDIQTLAQAQSAADVVWGIVGILPGFGEARNAYKIAEKAGDLEAMKKALEQGTAIATQKGHVNKAKVNANQTVLKVNSKADQNLVNKIAKGEDKGGELTEQLFNSLAKQNGFTVIKGGKYGSNNGFDHVWVAKDGSVTILSDSKQIKNGTVKLDSKAAGGNMQLSQAWVKAVLDKLHENDPTRSIVENAIKTGRFRTAVTGVDRATGQAVIIPVNVPAKSKPTVKK